MNHPDDHSTGSVSALQEDWEQDYGDGGVWLEVVGENGEVYYENSVTGETSWDDPSQVGHGSQDDEYHNDYTAIEEGGVDVNEYDEHGEYDHEYGSRYEVDIPDPDPTGVKTALAAFTVPPRVPKRWTDFGCSILFHGVENPSDFLRINVFAAENPPRESFRLDSAPEEWATKMVFYAFKEKMPNTARYNISYSMNPYRNRLLPMKPGSQAKRDISRWNVSRKVEETGFWAFPVSVPGSELFHVDWTSSPDRYKITTKAAPEWQWTRCFSFFAYTAAKFHLLECVDPQAYKVVEGNVLGDSIGKDEDGDQWNVILSFYAFKTAVPGTNKYYIQHQFEPHYRVRIGMEPSQSKLAGWIDLTYFYAFDTAMPGTAKLNVQYTIRSTEAYALTAEQSRIYTKDPWGSWENKFSFYAFPADKIKVQEHEGEHTVVNSPGKK